jgi:hypothetical protein
MAGPELLYRDTPLSAGLHDPIKDTLSDYPTHVKLVASVAILTPPISPQFAHIFIRVTIIYLSVVSVNCLQVPSRLDHI